MTKFLYHFAFHFNDWHLLKMSAYPLVGLQSSLTILTSYISFNTAFATLYFYTKLCHVILRYL